MSGLPLQKIGPLKDPEVYGNNSISDDYPSDFLSISAWLPYQGIQLTNKSTFWITSAPYKEDKIIPVDDWPTNIDTFTQSNLIEIEDKMVQQFIFQIRKSSLIFQGRNIANRILSLFNSVKEEDNNSPGISIGSLRNFYSFLKENSKLKYPNITLTPDNEIYASWEEKMNWLFSVHFLPDGNTNFVIFKPNFKNPKHKIRLSGSVTVDSLMETVIPNGVNEWIFE
jgi:hypothetical protein